MALLTEFLLRLSFGLAAAMATVSPRLVSSGYFRNHLYVTLGLSALAALLSRAASPTAFVPALLAAAASYLGSVTWLYEKPRFGLAALVVVAAAALWGALAVGNAENSHITGSSAAFVQSEVLRQVQVVTSGMLLGLTLAAMLLGHWYLNAPGMKLAPLRRLLILMGVATALHASICGLGLWMEASSRDPATTFWLFVALRWLFGLVGVGAMIVMAWKTLAIPNTQAATGLLYVAVIGAFVGETMSLLLSAESLFPV